MYFFINLENIFYFKSWTKLPTQFLSVQSICAFHLILLSIHLVYSTLFHHLQNRYEKFTSWQGLFSPHYPHLPRHTPAAHVLMGLSYCHVCGQILPSLPLLRILTVEQLPELLIAS